MVRDDNAFVIMPEKNNAIVTFLRDNAWALAIVIASVIAQWSVFGVRLTNIEQRQDRQGATIVSLQSSVADVQTQYAALNAKLDALGDNVLYIRNRIDNTR